MDRLPQTVSNLAASLVLESSKPINPTSIYNITSSIIQHTIFSKGICNDSCSNVPFTCHEVGHTWHPSCFRSSLHLFFGCCKEAINIYGLLYITKMTLFSKPVILKATCYETVHPYHPSCTIAWLLAFYFTFKDSVAIYASLYTVAAILRRRPFKYFLTKLPYETLRSTVFLAANCFYFLVFFCLGRKLFGRISYGGIFLTNLPACFLSIIIERKQRRGLLALYLANLATETGFNMMIDRKWINPIHNGQVLLFSFISAAYVFLYRTKALDGSLFNIIRIFLGSEEIHDAQQKQKLDRKSRIVKSYGFVTEILNDLINLTLNKKNTSNVRYKHNRIYILMKSFEEKLDRFFNKLSIAKGFKHQLCSHRYSCPIHSLSGFITRFFSGFLLQAGIKLATSIVSVIKRPKNIKNILTNPANIELGLFFGFYNLIYRLCNCLFRWITNKNSQYNSLFSGFFAGWSMIFYKSSSITLYLTFKLFEILWMLGVKSNRLPLYKNFDILLYTIATAFILWVGIFEPHNIRPQYWRFLVRISSKKFAEVNRHILDVFGTKASTINQAYRPFYDSKLTLLNTHLHS